MVFNVNDMKPPSKRPATELEFWRARDELRHILEYAEARLVGPWGVLGVVLVRTITATPVFVKLPATTGGVMSLNMFCAAVGDSGEGKGGVEAVAREAFTFTNEHGLMDLPELAIGTGEGMIKSFHGSSRMQEDDRPTNICFTAPEIDTLAAILDRSGSTAEGVFRSMYSGERLGFSNAQKDTRSVLPAHSYRATLVVGVQPLRADSLLNSKDGGTPQRFIWMPVHDPYTPDDDRVAPEPRSIAVGGKPWQEFVKLDDVIIKQIRDDRRRVLRRDPTVSALDKHRSLTVLKVATALAVLNGRDTEPLTVTTDDWDLAQVILNKSDDTRAEIEEQSREKARNAVRARAMATAERDDIIGMSKVEKAKSGVLARLSRLRDGEYLTRYEIRCGLRGDLRNEIDVALHELLADNKIRLEKRDGKDVYGGGQVDSGVHPQ